VLDCDAWLFGLVAEIELDGWGGHVEVVWVFVGVGGRDEGEFGIGMGMGIEERWEEE
jgi:hypothetical protein